MKRHPALVALSHDHHHALVEARRLRRAAAADEAPSAAAVAFRRFFAAVTVPHFREEEETLFPLLVDAEEARPLLVEALLDHQRLHALAATLDGSADVRRTMRELFPLIERLAPSQLDGLNSSDVPHSGPVWGAASEDLNATLLAWSAGGGPPEHVNGERDVLVFVADGLATVTVDGEERELIAGEALIVGKGRRRRITAGAGGVRYLSVHLRRPPLAIQPANARREA
jgi:mannose-6-phosphate isomerase-like protein (cupin superfamily)